MFLYAGVNHLRGLDGLATRLASAGWPAPSVLAVLATIATLAGGASVLLGALTPLGCLSIVLFLIPATWGFHVPQALAGEGAQVIQTWKNLAMMGGALFLLAAGPGDFSVDRHLRGRVRWLA